MAGTQIYGFYCTNEACGKLFKMKHPGKGGNYKVACPHCGHKLVVAMPTLPQDEKASEPQRQTQSGEKKPEEKKPADNSGLPVIDYTDYPQDTHYFFVGEKSIILCPHCKQRKMAYTAPKEGMLTFTCPGCKGKVRAEFRKPTVVIDPERINSRQGKIVHVKPLWMSTDYPLPLGVHTIGRADIQRPSTISIKGDRAMSRRSVEITASISAAEGFRYLLKVLATTNPVTLNGRELSEEEEVYLSFGDEIRLGSSLFRFIEDPKAPRLGNM